MRALVGLVLALSFLVAGAQTPTQGMLDSVEKKIEAVLRDEKPPYAHARRSPTETPEAARRKINAWIRYNLQLASDSRVKGDSEGALFSFLTARHALRDSVSPDANDEQGNPAILDVGARAEHKASSTNFWKDKVDEDMQAMLDNNFVPGGDLLRMYGIDSEKGPIDRPNQVPRPEIRRK